MPERGDVFHPTVPAERPEDRKERRQREVAEHHKKEAVKDDEHDPIRVAEHDNEAFAEFHRKAGKMADSIARSEAREEVAEASADRQALEDANSQLEIISRNYDKLAEVAAECHAAERKAILALICSKLKVSGFNRYTEAELTKNATLNELITLIEARGK